MSDKYQKNPNLIVTAVKLDLDMKPLEYTKWGGQQICKAGDWIVNNEGETYSIDAESFAETYEMVSPGVYVKTGNVWAEVALEDGSVSTKEGESAYKAGDYLVCNDPNGVDTYCVSKAKFEAMYVECD
jgi:hypothetical protein